MSGWQELCEGAAPVLPGREARARRCRAMHRLFVDTYGPLPVVVKLTGTSGKGSVAAMLEAALLADGARVGLFTSPHLVDPTERVRAGGADVTSAELDRVAAATAPFFEALLRLHGPQAQLSFFEALLVLALRWFQENDVAVAVLEVAVGGYNDALASVPGPLAAITSVGLDHAAELGPGIADVAADKAGIASADSRLVLGPALPPEARDAILRDVLPRGVRVIDAARDTIDARSLGMRGHDVTIATADDPVRFRLPLAGAFQVDNLATAVALFAELGTLGVARSAQSLAGMARTRWAGRMETLDGRWLLDCAHNELAFRALRDCLDASDRPRTLLFGSSDIDKTAAGLALLAPLCDRVCLVEGFYKSVPAATQASLAHAAGARAPVTLFASPAEAVAALSAPDSNSKAHAVLVTGSVYLVGACREDLLRRRPGAASA